MKYFSIISIAFMLTLAVPATQLSYGGIIVIPECTPPPDDMVSWWTGDVDATDFLGNNDGTIFGDTGFVAGKVGQAFSLDGSGDYVEIANEANFDFADSEYAVDGWFKTSASGIRQMIVTKAGSTTGFSMQVEIASSNKLVAGLFSGTNGQDVIVKVSTNTLNDGAWHHFAVNFDNTNPETATLYIDGVLDDNLLTDSTGALVAIISDEPVIIGARNIAKPQLFFNGMIDEVEIFDRHLTAQEIFDIWFAGSEGKCKEPEPVLNTIHIEKFYDANANGINDEEEELLLGWLVEISEFFNDAVVDDSSSTTFTTAWVDVSSGTYVVAEAESLVGDWFPTNNIPTVIPFFGSDNTIKVSSSTTFVIVGTSSLTVEFGNVCLGTTEKDVMSKGFWTNKHGQALIDDPDDIDDLNALFLADKDGPQEDFEDAGDVKQFLKKAKAKNMANMLSAQLAAMQLNVNHDPDIGDLIVHAPGVDENTDFLTIQQLMNAADEELEDDPDTRLPSDERDHQEIKKDVLDDANNNEPIFVQPDACEFGFDPPE